MQVQTDRERKAYQRQIVLAFFIGLLTLLIGGTIIHSDPSSLFHWVCGIVAIAAGAILEEKVVLRRK